MHAMSVDYISKSIGILSTYKKKKKQNTVFPFLVKEGSNIDLSHVMNLASPPTLCK